MKTKVHVVPHTHWDREWYFTTSRSKVYLTKDLRDVLDTLELNSEFKYFMLDAQASLIDDYIKWYPEETERIKQLVINKRLIIGPWYTQTDQLVISGESIVRNLHYGIKRCKEFGTYMNVGYVPDSFGQSAQMPQIYKGFGIHDTLFWRGVSDDMTKYTEFIWEGSDKTSVFAVQMPFGYYYGGSIPEHKDQMVPYLKSQVERLKVKATSNNIYFPNGFDQAPIRINLPDILAKANEVDNENEYIISSCEDYISSVKENDVVRDVIRGELVNGKHMRIHKSIFSSRSDLKIKNNKIENFITNTLEPILTISHALGNEYPHRVVEEIWKLMLENAAHDSIGACNSDSTNKDVAFRYKLAGELAENLLDLHMRLISTKIKNNNEEFTFTLFNTLPIPREGVIEFEAFIPDGEFSIKDHSGNYLKYYIKDKVNLTDYVLNQTIHLNPSKKIYIPNEVYKATIVIEVNEIPSLGYCQLYFDLNKQTNALSQQLDSNYIENEYFKISVNNNGTINILDKESNITYLNQAMLEESGDDGDSYNFSPPREDLIITSLDGKMTYDCVKTSICEELHLQVDLEVPYNLEERAQGKCSTSMVIHMTVRLNKKDNLIYFILNLNNQAMSHRLRVLFDTDICSKFSIADQQFGLIKRPTELSEDLKLWERDEKNWQEMPITIEPMQSFSCLTKDNRGVAIITNGVREYQIVGEQYNTIALTLFRTFGYMGKEDLIYRPGRASGEKIVETPDAQLIGELKFELALYIFNKEFDLAHVANRAKLYLSPIVTYQYSDFLNGRLIYAFRDEEKIYDKSFSLGYVEDSNFSISAIKQAEEEDGIIIRIFNGLSEAPVSGKILLNKDIKSVFDVNLNEEYDSQIDLLTTNREININDLQHCKIKTILFKS